MHDLHDRTPTCCTRRHFLASHALGIGGIALAWLLGEEGQSAQQERPELEPPTYDLRPRPPHHEPHANAMISLWMQGGPSQVDLCDPKPTLARYDGSDLPDDLPEEVGMANNPTSKTIMASPWKFNRHGQSGMAFSELLPHIGAVADDITLVRSMYAPTVNNHIQASRALQRADGSNRLGNSDRPSLGSWITYGLGSESQNLPACSSLRRKRWISRRRPPRRNGSTASTTP